MIRIHASNIEFRLYKLNFPISNLTKLYSNSLNIIQIGQNITELGKFGFLLIQLLCEHLCSSFHIRHIRPLVLVDFMYVWNFFKGRPPI